MFESLFGKSKQPVKEKVPQKSIYDQRIECLEKMLHQQKDAKATDEQYIKVSCIEGKCDSDSWRRLEHYQGQYRLTYAACENILKVY
jgi:hypothetical protein